MVHPSTHDPFCAHRRYAFHQIITLHKSLCLKILILILDVKGIWIYQQFQGSPVEKMSIDILNLMAFRLNSSNIKHAFPIPPKQGKTTIWFKKKK